jgi:hypothetical protein
LQLIEWVAMMKRALIIAALLWPPEQYATTYGQVVINHLNFTRDRINPYFTQNATVGVDLYKRENRTLQFQADIANVSNTLELIDFGGLFSGNAI